MVQYYRLNLNCARVSDKSPYANDYGFIKVLPVEGTMVKQGFFGSKVVPKTEYIGEYYVIAVKEKDYFKDAILGKTIKYYPEGLFDITTASEEDLENNLFCGLSCNSFEKIDYETACFNIKKIRSDSRCLEKYYFELEELEKKENVVEELNRRKELELDINTKSKTPVKSLKRVRISA